MSEFKKVLTIIVVFVLVGQIRADVTPEPEKNELVYHDCSAFYFALLALPLEEPEKINGEAVKGLRFQAAQCAFIIYLDRKKLIDSGSTRADRAYRNRMSVLLEYVSEKEFRDYMGKEFDSLKRTYGIELERNKLKENLDAFFALINSPAPLPNE